MSPYPVYCPYCGNVRTYNYIICFRHQVWTSSLSMVSSYSNALFGQASTQAGLSPASSLFMQRSHLNACLSLPARLGWAAPYGQPTTQPQHPTQRSSSRYTMPLSSRCIAPLMHASMHQGCLQCLHIDENANGDSTSTTAFVLPRRPSLLYALTGSSLRECVATQATSQL